MKLKKDIEKAIAMAGKNVRTADKKAENEVEAHDELLFWSGVQEALTWVLEKREIGLDDFVSYQ